jgi:hypothetical protein
MDSQILIEHDRKWKVSFDIMILLKFIIIKYLILV